MPSCGGGQEVKGWKSWTIQRSAPGSEWCYRTVRHVHRRDARYIDARTPCTSTRRIPKPDLVHRRDASRRIHRRNASRNFFPQVEMLYEHIRTTQELEQERKSIVSSGPRSASVKPVASLHRPMPSYFLERGAGRSIVRRCERGVVGPMRAGCCWEHRPMPLYFLERGAGRSPMSSSSGVQVLDRSSSRGVLVFLERGVGSSPMSLADSGKSVREKKIVSRPN